MQHEQRILVVGASAGIGAALVERLGDRCHSWSRSSGVDVSDADCLEAAAEKLLARDGPPFGLVHCVGDFAEQSILETDPELFDRILQSNLKTAFLVLRQFIPAMSAAGRGRIILFAAAGLGAGAAKIRAPRLLRCQGRVVVDGAFLRLGSSAQCCDRQHDFSRVDRPRVE